MHEIMEILDTLGKACISAHFPVIMDHGRNRFP